MGETRCQVPRRPLKHFKVEPDETNSRKGWRVVEEQGDGSSTDVCTNLSRCKANRSAKYRAKQEPYGALVTTCAYPTQRRPPLLIVGGKNAYRLVKENVLSYPGILISIAIFIILALCSIVFYYITCTTNDPSIDACISVSKLFKYNTDLIITPAALFITSGSAIAAMVAVDHKTPWSLRRTAIVTAVNIIMVSVAVIILGFVYKLLPEISIVSKRLIIIIQDVVGVLAISLLVLVIWGIGRIIFSLYFFSINASHPCGSADVGKP